MIKKIKNFCFFNILRIKKFTTALTPSITACDILRFNEPTVNYFYAPVAIWAVDEFSPLETVSPISIAEWSKASTVFGRSNNEIARYTNCLIDSQVKTPRHRKVKEDD
jgi:hypothetical protein